MIKFSALALGLMLAASCGGESRGMPSAMEGSDGMESAGGERMEMAPSYAPSDERVEEMADRSQDTPYADLLPDGGTLAELPEHDIVLTEAENGVTLRAGEREQVYDWLYMTPRGIKPNMALRDWDGDGMDELAIILYVGSGTGVSVSDLRIIEFGETGFHDTYFEPDDYVRQILNVAGFSALRENEELQGRLTLGDSAHTVSLKEYDEDQMGEVRDKLVIGSIANFGLKRTGLSPASAQASRWRSSRPPLYRQSRSRRRIRIRHIPPDGFPVCAESGAVAAEIQQVQKKIIRL